MGSKLQQLKESYTEVETFQKIPNRKSGHRPRRYRGGAAARRRELGRINRACKGASMLLTA